MARFFSNAKLESVAADLLLSDGMQLNNYGVNATVIATPGHTPVSVSALSPEGDAIVGDVLMGGFLGGALFPTKPNFHYIADDIDQAMESLDLKLSQSSNKLYVGHGGPLVHEEVGAWRLRHQRNTGG